MNSVELVKAICKERKIPISKLERDLGYGNGYIGQLKKGTFPSDRLADISAYLGVSVVSLMGEDNEKTPSLQAEKERSPVQLEAIAIIDDMTDEEIARFIAVAKIIKGEN